MGKTLLICLTLLLFCSALIAVLLGISSGLLNFMFHKVLEKEINKRMTLIEGHASYEQLQNPSIPTFKSLYFFNLTNPEEFENGTARAVLEEVGPYTYGEVRLKTFGDGEDRTQLSFTHTQYYFFNSNNGSGLSESDVICTINIPLMVGVYAVLEIPEYQDLFKYLINITSAQLYTCQNVSGLIWGYTDAYLQKLHELGLSPVEKSWLMSNESSSSGSNTIHTGVKNISMLAQFLEWNGNEGYMDVWPSREANRIHGTEGVFFKPNLRCGEDLVLFVGDLMRVFELENIAIVNHLGLDTLRYRFHSSIFNGAFTEPSNAQWGSWCPDGMFYLGPLKDPEIPVYGSKPHFLDGAWSLQEGVEGLSPSRQHHDSHIDVEPNIGVNVDFSIQIQLNVRVNASANFSFLENLQGVDSHGSLFMPVVYINEYAEFSQDLKDYLDKSGLEQIQQLENVATMLFYVLIGLAAVSTLVSMVAAIALIWSVLKIKYRKEEEKPLLQDPDLPAAIVHEYFSKRRSRDVI